MFKCRSSANQLINHAATSLAIMKLRKVQVFADVDATC